MKPEDEYFARREGEIERERDRRDAAPEEPEKLRGSLSQQRDDAQPSTDARADAEAKGRASRIVGAMSTAMKGLFGIRGNRRPRHA